MFLIDVTLNAEDAENTSVITNEAIPKGMLIWTNILNSDLSEELNEILASDGEYPFDTITEKDYITKGSSPNVFITEDAIVAIKDIPSGTPLIY